MSKLNLLLAPLFCFMLGVACASSDSTEEEQTSAPTGDMLIPDTPEGTLETIARSMKEDPEDIAISYLAVLRTLVAEDCEHPFCIAVHDGDTEALVAGAPDELTIHDEAFEFQLDGNPAVLKWATVAVERGTFDMLYGLVFDGDAYRVHLIGELDADRALVAASVETWLAAALDQLDSSLSTENGQAFLATNPAEPLAEFGSRFSDYLDEASEISLQGRLLITAILRDMGKPVSDGLMGLMDNLIAGVDSALEEAGVTTISEQMDR